VRTCDGRCSRGARGLLELLGQPEERLLVRLNEDGRRGKANVHGRVRKEIVVAGDESAPRSGVPLGDRDELQIAVGQEELR